MRVVLMLPSLCRNCDSLKTVPIGAKAQAKKMHSHLRELCIFYAKENLTKSYALSGLYFIRLGCESLPLRFTKSSW
jgi:hypothetical protein